MQDAPKIEMNKEEKVVRELEQLHRCEQHSIAEYVAPDGKHTPYTHQPLSMWAFAIVSLTLTEANLHTDVGCRLTIART